MLWLRGGLLKSRFLRGLLFGGRVGDFVVVVVVVVLVVVVVVALLGLRGIKVVLRRPDRGRGRVVVAVLLLVGLLLLLLGEVEGVFWLGSWKRAAESASDRINVAADFWRRAQ